MQDNIDKICKMTTPNIKNVDVFENELGLFISPAWFHPALSQK